MAVRWRPPPLGGTHVKRGMEADESVSAASEQTRTLPAESSVDRKPLTAASASAPWPERRGVGQVTRDRGSPRGLGRRMGTSSVVAKPLLVLRGRVAKVHRVQGTTVSAQTSLGPEGPRPLDRVTRE